MNRTIYNLKTLQIKPTNGLHLKGLLTYRTFQFSMSSGCFHPKITLVSLPTCLILKALSHQGKKNPRADLINLNSATQTYVNFQLLYSLFTDCQRLFIFFFAGVAHLQLPSTYLFPGYCQKLFSAARLSRFPKNKAETILPGNLRKCFRKFLFDCLYRFTFVWSWTQETQLQNRDARQQFSQDPGV